MDFPSSPITGQLYAFAGRIWQFDGEGWRRVINSNQIVSVFITLVTNEQAVTSLPAPIVRTWTLLNYV